MDDLRPGLLVSGLDALGGMLGLRYPWGWAVGRACGGLEGAVQEPGRVMRAMLPAIDVPVLVIHRRHDCKVDFRLGSYLAEHLPRARLELLEGVDHLPYRGDSVAVTDVIDRFMRGADSEHLPARAGLSPRECDVLRLVAEGLHNREIAAWLGVSPATVSRHLANIYAKLGIATRAGAASFAIRGGLV